jgi:hypothetical protein
MQPMPVDPALLNQLRQTVIRQKNLPAIDDPGERSPFHDVYARLAAFDVAVTQAVIRALGGHLPETGSLPADPALSAEIERLAAISTEKEQPILEQYRHHKERLDQTLALLARIAMGSSGAP